MHYIPFVFSSVLVAVAMFFLAYPRDKGMFPFFIRKLATGNEYYRKRFFRKIATHGRDIKPTSYGLMVWLLVLMSAPVFMFFIMPTMTYLTNAVLVIVGIVYFMLLLIVLFTRAEYAVIHAMQRRHQSKMPILRANIDPKQYAKLEFALGSVMSFQEYDRLMDQIDDLVRKLPSHLR